MIRELHQYHVVCDGLTPEGAGAKCNSQRMIMAYSEDDLRSKLEANRWRTTDGRHLCPGLHADVSQMPGG